MARSGLRVLRFAVLAIIVLLVLFKISTDHVDLTKYVASKGPKIDGSSGAANSGGDVAKDQKQEKPSQSLTGDTTEKQSPAPYQRANATFVTLARNGDLWSIVESIRQVEDRFNHKYNYDWVFLNDVEFDEEFKKVTTAMISGKTKYDVIPKGMWSFPDWIDQEKAALVREQMRQEEVIYGDSIPYRHMCRFESGFFWRHPALNDYKYYWRVEPDIKLFCDVEYDVFKFMEEKGKKYGFTISLYEYEKTIPTLWKTTKEFVDANPQYLPKDNLMQFVSDDGGDTYNKCHFWSNFEIASLDFWRGEAYTKYFEHLDKAGGFFYERWGDAPVHSIAAALFLEKDEIHYFEDVGYFHVPFHNCPTEEEVRLRQRCTCKAEDNFAWRGYSCTPRYYNAKGLQRPKGWQDQTE